MGDNAIAAHDPSVRDYAATSPYEWGGELCQMPVAHMNGQERALKLC
jgi:hypothetical protein